ncbi:hypothetical protein [Croceicoccus naphthovorans]|uniref:Uncharacterized protein n=1 Tax=Croceicoccus naphthovorans TaxID=1348774 RepID=A0A0G3XG22_9SPHN|nr:hypothetical protein [Croceicoccus naphthovorans]AKM09343.1 hypothetical protein AB433_04065 [Croceicoccus naphthovorans]MBB3990257.1 putative flap endonuclease-1-like 5' DNA nuclease [Croceicoccus naphthovorans]
MVELVQANWVAFTIVAVLAVIIALWLLARPRKERVRSHRPDVLDEGVGPAKRNQALIDAPSATTGVTHEHEPPVAPEGMAGMGEAIGAAAWVHDEQMHAKDADQMPDTAEDAQAVAVAIKIGAEGGDADDLSRIKGVGPKLLTMLGDMGISRFDQIAAWSDDDVQKIDGQLGRFAGRIDRDDWRAQAKYLAEGDTAGYEEKFGKL